MEAEGGDHAVDRAEALRAPSSLADQIAQILEDEILEGQYSDGSHLQQEEICGRFGVSRTPAREALRKLQAHNLVELVPNRGARVRMPTLRELNDVYQLRAELEGFAAELAARSREPDMLAALEKAHNTLSQIVPLAAGTLDTPDEAETGERLRRFNDMFHGVIHDAGGNQRLGNMIQELHRYFPKDTVRLAIRSPETLRSLYIDEHTAILEEIMQGRAAAARDAMRDHIHGSQTMLVDYLRKRGFPD
ncbi:GntR family transcriptional regulator [Prauserella alba]|uniref:GntR family transcriptional regulator n=1 Tax=Prauserella alba TaxID=176898 RepID=A0ABN1VMD3_9PSEU|nr:GntR family transcriptional regulator [Prauserella alba]MCP2180796.1 DNA-binding transcriptional regulator, GntR family [Prauserella alba]